jgi:hypothetical protein
MDTVRAAVRRVSKRLLNKKSKWSSSVYPSPLPRYPVTSVTRMSRSLSVQAGRLPMPCSSVSCFSCPIPQSHVPMSLLLLWLRCNTSSLICLLTSQISQAKMSWPFHATSLMSLIALPLAQSLLRRDVLCQLVHWTLSGWDNILPFLPPDSLTSIIEPTITFFSQFHMNDSFSVYLTDLVIDHF